MQTNSLLKIYKSIVVFVAGIILLLLSSCVSVDPAKVDVSLEETMPEEKVTSFSEALVDLGLMTEIYGTGSVKVQSNEIHDNTGTASSTGGEIPRDISEMLKSTLNSIGGNILYIPYDPAFIQNMNVTGYSSFEGKLIPDVVVSGGITEFDRGLSTRGKNTDAGVEATFTNAPSWTPSGTVGFQYGDGSKQGLARITLDFNMLDFQTMSGVPRMNTINSMEVRKALAERQLGITLFGPTFGRKGTIKKVQGRHAAVRLLVEVSMIQMMGKYLVLPYWRLIGNDLEPDPVVLRQIKAYYYKLSPSEQIGSAQQWLFLHGYNIAFTGQLDMSTIKAVQAVVPDFAGNQIDLATFMEIYTTIPIDESVIGRRTQMVARLNQGGGASQQTSTQTESEYSQQAYQTQTQTQTQTQYNQQNQAASQNEPQTQNNQQNETTNQTQTQYSQKSQAEYQTGNASTTASSPQTRNQQPTKRKAGIGSMLSDDEW